MLKLNKIFKTNNYKSKITTATLLLFGLALFIFDCECEVDTDPASSTSSITPTTTTQSQIISSNYRAFFHDTNDFSNYQILTNLVAYEVWELKRSYYTLTVGGGETISNFERFTTSTNYSTNVLMTNDISSLFNQTFQTVSDDFIVTSHTNDYCLIRDSNIVGYSNYLQTRMNVKTNTISKFDLINSTFSLNTNNANSRGITAYNDNFYIVDRSDSRVYLYNNTGIYQSDFPLHSDNSNASGITAYSNKFYITDFSC